MALNSRLVTALILFCTVVIIAGQNHWRDNTYDGSGKDERKPVIWCTVSRAEQRKCIALARAIDRDRLKVGYDYYKFECKHAFNKDECMHLLDEERVTMTSLDAGEAFIGGRFHSLVPIAQEISDTGANFQYAVAVIKRGSNSDVANLRDLRGKKACFAGVGTMAGWIVPVHTLMKEAGMAIIDCNNHVKTATNFFGPSCAVNALSDQNNPIGDNSDRLCQLCIGKVPGGKCTSSDPYAGFDGAFRCLLEAGDIAFLRHNTVEELTAQDMEFSSVDRSQFELFCRDGSRRAIQEYRACHWGTVPTNAIVVSSASSFNDRLQYQRMLKRLAVMYGVPSNSTEGRNFAPTFDNERNRNLGPEGDRGRFDDRGRNKRDVRRDEESLKVVGLPETAEDQKVRSERQVLGLLDRDRDRNQDPNRDRDLDPNRNRDPFNRDPVQDRDRNRDFDRTRDDPNRPRDGDFDRNRDNFDRNRDNFDRNRDNENTGPYANDPFSRDPFSINRDQYGHNIDPYETHDVKYNRDRDRYNDSYYDDFDRSRNKTFYELFNMFESSPRFGHETNLIFLDSTRKFSPLDEQHQTYSGYLGKNVELVHGVRDCPVNSMTLCVTSDVELEKCIKMRTALKAQLLKPDMVCYKGHSHINCMQSIAAGTADVTVLDASDVYTAGLNFELIPFISEVYNLEDPEYYVVAVAKEADPDTEITYLKGKYTCHGGINTAAGWVYPLAYLMSNGWIRPYGCNSVRAAAEYFTKSCVPGALSTEYNTGVPYDNMCDLCHGTSYRYCRRDASEDYYGHTGAFRCLVEGGGHVAFVKHTTVNENTGGKRREWWARDALVDDFELLCPDGTRAEVNEYKRCNLGRVKANAVVTRGGYGYNETQLNAFINLFLYSQTFYGKKIPDEFSFSMFYSTPPYTDLIFQDATTQLRIVPPHERYYASYVGKDFLRARRIVDCKAGST